MFFIRQVGLVWQSQFLANQVSKIGIFVLAKFGQVCFRQVRQVNFVGKVLVCKIESLNCQRSFKSVLTFSSLAIVKNYVSGKM